MEQEKEIAVSKSLEMVSENQIDSDRNPDQIILKEVKLMTQNKINVTRSSMPPLEEYIEELKPVWESRWLSNRGAACLKLESQLESYLQVDHVATFSNGHLALETALQACGFPRGSEVITTPYTHVSTTHAIVRSGLIPVFTDIEPVHYTLDPDRIEEAITEKTVAILATHVYGFPCDVERIAEIAAKHHLTVIYDSAHGFGVTYKGTSIANFGDIAMFSTHATKVFHTIEGGLLTRKDTEEERFEVVRRLQNFGHVAEDDVRYVGTNAKMSEFSAVMGICNLRHLEENIALRHAADARYCERLMGVPGIHVPRPDEHTKWNHIYFPVIFDGFRLTRDEVKQHLADHGIYARKYFYPLTNEENIYKEQYGTADIPVARRIAQNVLTLPMFSDLTPEMVDNICDIILKED